MTGQPRAGVPAKNTAPLEKFGPFFALLTDTDANEPSLGGTASSRWYSVAELMASTVLVERVEHFRAAMAARGPVGETAADTRALASTMALGMFARLLSPSIGAFLTGTPSLRPDPETTWIYPVESGPVPLRTSAPLSRAEPDKVVERLVLPLASAVAARFRVSERVLSGNAAAALVGACHVVALVEPSRSANAAALRERMLSTPPLAGTGTATGPFVRSSCCLIYRLPMGYICRNCILVAKRTKTARRKAAEMTLQTRADARRHDIDWTRAPFR